MLTLRKLQPTSTFLPVWHCVRLYGQKGKGGDKEEGKSGDGKGGEGKPGEGKSTDGKPPEPQKSEAELEAERIQCKCGKVKRAILKKMDASFNDFEEAESKSLLKKHLTNAIYCKLKRLQTPCYCSSLLDVIQSGLCHLDSNVGLYAPDPDAYRIFAPLFDPVLDDYHGFRVGTSHPEPCFGYGCDFPDMDPERKYILSTRVRVGRSLEGYPFVARMKEHHYEEIECKIKRALKTLHDEYTGKYFPLCSLDDHLKCKLVKHHYLFKEDDRFLKAAKALRFWPTGRGIYINCAKTFLVWVNEEDHMRVISMETGGDIGRVYERLIVSLELLGKCLDFVHDRRLGYLTFCPTNVGSALRASVHIRLPLLTKEQIEDITKKYNLQVRGSSGEHSDTEDGVMDVSNKQRLGITEYESITQVYNGVRALIDAECIAEDKCCNS